MISVKQFQVHKFWYVVNHVVKKLFILIIIWNRMRCAFLILCDNCVNNDRVITQ